MPENGDVIDSAIAKSKAVVMEQTQVTISSTGRPFIVSFPRDMTDAELVEVIGWMGTALRNHLVQQRTKTAGGRIVLPT